MAKARAVGALLEGQHELIKALEELTDKEFRAAIRSVGRAAMKPVAEIAAQNAPVETGSLRNSIGIRVKIYPRQGNVLFVVGPRSGHSMESGAEFQGKRKTRSLKRRRDPRWYAHLVEGGFTARGKSKRGFVITKRGRIGRGKIKGSGKVLAKIAPRPFLRPAFESKANGMPAQIGRALNAYFERRARRLAAKTARLKAAA